MSLNHKIRAAKALAERGATEGERNAARAALERLEKHAPKSKLAVDGWHIKLRDISFEFAGAHSFSMEAEFRRRFAEVLNEVLKK